MKEYNFFAFHPERFDPRIEITSSDEPIRWRIERIALHPPVENQALVQLGRALEDWAKSQDTNDIHDVHAVEMYSDDWHSSFEESEARFFYLQALPSEGLDDFYYHMITTANQLGLIVFCDIDDGLYYPDGTSDPAFLYPNLIKHKQQAAKIVNTQFDSDKPLPDYKKEVVPLLKPMMSDVLDKLGVTGATFKYADRCWSVTIKWQDATIRLSAHIDRVYPTDKTLLRLHFFIQPKNYSRNKSYKVLFTEEDVPSFFLDMRDKIGIEGEVSALEEFRIFSSLRHHNYSEEEAKEILVNYRQSLGVDTERELYAYVSRQLQEVFSWLAGHQSLYELYNDIYEDTSHPLHEYYWAPPFEHVTFNTINYSFRHESSLLLARYLHHPDLLKMLEQWQVFGLIDIDIWDSEESLKASQKNKLAYFCNELQKGYEFK